MVFCISSVSLQFFFLSLVILIWTLYPSWLIWLKICPICNFFQRINLATNETSIWHLPPQGATINTGGVGVHMSKTVSFGLLPSWTLSIYSCLHNSCQNCRQLTFQCGVERGSQVPPLPVEELLRGHGFLKVEFVSVFFKVWPLLGQPYFSEWPYAYMYIGSTHWTLWVI